MFVLVLLSVGWIEAALRIDTIEPIYLQVGKKTKVKIKGNEFKLLEWPTRIWTNHPSKWTLLEEEDNTNNQHFFEVEIAKDVPAGPLAIRAWNLKGRVQAHFCLWSTFTNQSRLEPNITRHMNIDSRRRRGSDLSVRSGRID
jgi:hypothetical protein